jgi:hypothetical protein
VIVVLESIFNKGFSHRLHFVARTFYFRHPEKTGVSIETITRAAIVVGRQLRIELV